MNQRIGREKHYGNSIYKGPKLGKGFSNTPKWQDPRLCYKGSQGSEHAGSWGPCYEFEFYSRLIHFEVKVWQAELRQMGSLQKLRKVLYLHQDGRWSGIDPRPQPWAIQYLPFQKKYSTQHKSENQNWNDSTILHTLPRDIYTFIPLLKYILNTLNSK